MTCFARQLDPFLKLGEVEIALIIELIDPVDIIRLQLVSVSWRILLNSEALSRIALIHSFPESSETIEFKQSQRNLVANSENKQVSAVSSFRRCTYRFHTRRLGHPTKISHTSIHSGPPSRGLESTLEWDAAEGFIAWITEESHLHVQEITGCANDRRSVCCKDVFKQHSIPLSQYDLDHAKVNVQIGNHVICATLNLYDFYEDGYGSGRRAIFLIFAIEDLRLLWHKKIELPDKILGEVDTAKGHLAYIRKRTKHDRSCEIHFVVHELHTGELKSQILLERGEELAKGDVFFIVVSDSTFKRLIVLYENGETSNAVVHARIYSIYDELWPLGKLLAERYIAHDETNWRPHNRRITINADLYMDYPPRLEKFDIGESFYASANIPADEMVTVSSDTECRQDDPEVDLLRLARCISALNAPMPLLPPIIPFNTWSIKTADSTKLNFIHSRYLAELSLDRDFFLAEHPMVSETDENGPPNLCRRFEVFLPLEECSAIFSCTAHQEFKCEIGIYEEVNSELKYRWSGDASQLRRELSGHWESSDNIDITDETDDDSKESQQQSQSTHREQTNMIRVLRQQSRRALTSKRLVHGAKIVSSDEDGLESVPYKIDPINGSILLKGAVDASFLHSVQWSERYLAVRTRWTVPRGNNFFGSLDDPFAHEYNTIVVFDFSPPW